MNVDRRARMRDERGEDRFFLNLLMTGRLNALLLEGQRWRVGRCGGAEVVEVFGDRGPFCGFYGF